MDMDVIKLARIILLADRRLWRCFFQDGRSCTSSACQKNWTSTKILSLKTYVFLSQFLRFCWTSGKQKAANQDNLCSNVEEPNGIVLPSCDKYENEDLDGNRQKKCSNVGEYNGIVLRRYDKSLRIQFQYERWKGRPSSQSCHDSSEHKHKYKYKHKHKHKYDYISNTNTNT